MTTLAVRYAQALRQSLGAGVAPKKVMDSFLGVVREHRRESLLPAILAAYEELEDRAVGRLKVKVATAQPLTDKQRALLIAQVQAAEPTAQDVVLVETVDAALKAGFKAEFAGKVWDASVQGRLEQLRGTLLKQN